MHSTLLAVTCRFKWWWCNPRIRKKGHVLLLLFFCAAYVFEIDNNFNFIHNDDSKSWQQMIIFIIILILVLLWKAYTWYKMLSILDLKKLKFYHINLPISDAYYQFQLPSQHGRDCKNPSIIIYKTGWHVCLSHKFCFDYLLLFLLYLPLINRFFLNDLRNDETKKASKESAKLGWRINKEIFLINY